MRHTHFLSVLVLAGTLLAQAPGPFPPGPPPFPAAIRLFLDLSDTQVETIRNLNADFSRLVSNKLRRLSQVQAEIGEKTARDPLDPMSIGLSYVEIEVIRRELNAELTRLRAKISQLLAEPQRARLKALEDITKLFPIYSEAVSVNLIEQPADFGGPFRVTGGFIPATRVFFPGGTEPEKETP